VAKGLNKLYRAKAKVAWKLIEKQQAPRMGKDLQILQTKSNVKECSKQRKDENGEGRGKGARECA
jgi:hypothetical protein